MEIFFIDVVKALIGTFVGAGLAFFVAWSVRQSQRENDQAAAGNTALLNLSQILYAFLEFKKLTLENHKKTLKEEPQKPIWLQLNLTHFPFNESLSIEINSLIFLCKPRTVETMYNIIDANIIYKDLIELHHLHSLKLTELQTQMSSFLHDNQQTILRKDLVDSNISAKLKIHLTQLNNHLLDFLNEKEHTLFAAFESLQKALKSELKSRIISINFEKIPLVVDASAKLTHAPISPDPL